MCTRRRSQLAGTRRLRRLDSPRTTRHVPARQHEPGAGDPAPVRRHASERRCALDDAPPLARATGDRPYRMRAIPDGLPAPDRAHGSDVRARRRERRVGRRQTGGGSRGRRLRGAERRPVRRAGAPHAHGRGGPLPASGHREALQDDLVRPEPGRRRAPVPPLRRRRRHAAAGVHGPRRDRRRRGSRFGVVRRVGMGGRAARELRRPRRARGRASSSPRSRRASGGTERTGRRTGRSSTCSGSSRAPTRHEQTRRATWFARR